MYLTADPMVTSGARLTEQLAKLAYFGIWAFVLALPWGGDTILVGSLPLASWILFVPLGVAMLRVTAKGTLRRYCAIHTLALLFVAWTAISYTWTIDPQSTTTRIGTNLQLLILAMLIWELATTRIRVRGLIVSYLLGSGIASVQTIYNYSIGWTTSREAGAEWETYRYSVNGLNADELALIIALSIPMALYLLSWNKNWLLKALCWVQTVIGFIAILLTGTRGAMIAAIMGVILMAGPTLCSTSWRQRSVALLACVALIFSVIYFVPKTSIDRYLSIGTELTQGTLTHRTVIWAAGLEVFRDHPFVGVGAGAYGPATVRIIDIPLIAHNTFISVLVELGVIGAFLFVALLGSLLYSVLRMGNLERQVWLAVLATWGIGACSVSWENRKTTWLLFSLVAAQAYAKSSAVFDRRHEKTLLARVKERSMQVFGSQIPLESPIEGTPLTR